MSQDSSPRQSRRRCANCGLVNAGSDELCRRCGSVLAEDGNFEQGIAQPPLPASKTKKRGFLKRVIWVLGATLVILIIWYVSLLISSDGLQTEQRQKVENAIALLQQQGFSREAFLLKHLTMFRSTDNWWNKYIGHRDAYAATNFPFEVVTVYPEFFQIPIDDRERAAVLLHEARHLFGEGEDAALQYTWQEKKRLGWTSDKYGRTRLWDATENLTRARFPWIFQCGSDRQSDCF